MDLTDLPFNTPIILRSYYEKILHSAFGSHLAICSPGRSDAFVWLELVLAKNGAIALRALRSRQLLTVDQCGNCFFNAHNLADADLFELKFGLHGWLVFVSCRTGKFLTTNENGSVWCGGEMSCDDKTLEWEIVAPSVELDVQDMNYVIQNDMKSLLNNVLHEVESMNRRAW